MSCRNLHEVRLWLLAAVALAATSCIAWQGGTAKEIERPMPRLKNSCHTSRKMTLAVEVKTPTTIEMNGRIVSKRYPIKKLADQALSENCRFFYSRFPRRADYLLSVEVDVEPGNDYDFQHILISFFTLTLFPYWDTETFVITAELKDRTGFVIARRQIRQYVTTLFQFFMLAAMPFTSPEDAYKKMWRKVMIDLVDWAERRVLWLPKWAGEETLNTPPTLREVSSSRRDQGRHAQQHR